MEQAHLARFQSLEPRHDRCGEDVEVRQPGQQRCAEPLDAARDQLGQGPCERDRRGLERVLLLEHRQDAQVRSRVDGRQGGQDLRDARDVPVGQRRRAPVGGPQRPAVQPRLDRRVLPLQGEDLQDPRGADAGCRCRDRLVEALERLQLAQGAPLPDLGDQVTPQLDDGPLHAGPEHRPWLQAGSTQELGPRARQVLVHRARMPRLTSRAPGERRVPVLEGPRPRRGSTSGPTNCLRSDHLARDCSPAAGPTPPVTRPDARTRPVTGPRDQAGGCRTCSPRCRGSTPATPSR